MNAMQELNSIHKNTLCQRGTTLVELMIAMGVFLVVGGAAFSLFNRQQIATAGLQSEVGLSLALRNTASQLQMDLANAGNGYLQGINIPAWPIGVVLANNFVAPTDTCYNSTTGTYGSRCFDAINIITAADPAIYPPINVTDSAGDSGGCSYSDSGFAYGQAAVVNGVTQTLNSTAAEFQTGDQVLFMTYDGRKVSTAVLGTPAPAPAGSVVKFNFTATNADGSNTRTNDPLDITTCLGNLSVNGVPCPAIADSYTNKFCGPGWIIKLAPIQYFVTANSDPNNPWQLMRKQNNVTSVVMDQIVGFKAGASIFNSTALAGFNTANYFYDASQYTIPGTPKPYDFALVRSVRVSVIGRTTPNNSSQYAYRNTFDGGPYQVQGTAVVVNPRNMSMNDN
jgi:type II secretory pathway pseudopilin PulG